MTPKDGGNHGRPPRRRWVSPGAVPRASVRRKADEIMRDAGLPQHLAMRVAKGELELKAALDQVLDKDRVEKLIRRHQLDRSLATQVVLGKLSLDEVVQRRRMKAHISENRDRSALNAALSDGRPRVIGLHGHRLVKAKVIAIDAFEVDLEEVSGDASAEALGRIHKLQLKFLADCDDVQTLDAMVDRDPEVEDRQPIERPQDRYRCADKRLFSWFDAKTPLVFTSLEGDVVTGPLTWIGRWELGVLGPGDVELVVFRHALANMSGGQWDSSKGG